MSQKAFTSFLETVYGSQDLQRKVKRLGTDAEVVAFACTLGYSFTESDLQSVLGRLEKEAALTDSDVASDQVVQLLPPSRT